MPEVFAAVQADPMPWLLHAVTAFALYWLFESDGDA